MIILGEYSNFDPQNRMHLVPSSHSQISIQRKGKPQG